MKRLIYVLALVKFLLPFLLQHSAYEPHRDEFLYMAEAHHLSLGYLELPPMLSVLAFIARVFGGGFFWIKFWPSLGGALTYVLVGRMILLLGGGRFALVLGFLPFVFGYFLHVHFMLQPNFLEMLAFTFMAYGLMLYVRTDKPKGLYLAGLGFGLGMLSKYSVGFFAGSLLLGLLLTPERKVFRNRHFYYSLLAGLLLFLPNLIWQVSHGWPFFHQMAALRQQQLDQVSRWNFIVDQLTYNLPGLPIWVAGLYYLFATVKGKPYRFVGWAVMLVLAFLTLARGKSYYAMSVYPVLFACGAVYLERVTVARRGSRWIGARGWGRHWRRSSGRGWRWGGRSGRRWGLLAFSVLTGCYLDMIALPMLPPERLVRYYEGHAIFRRLGFLRWEDQQDHALPQDFADMLGWKELTAKTARVYHSLDSAGGNSTGQDGGNGTVLDGGNYGEAGALDYYGRAYGLPPAMGHGASYLLWTPEHFYSRDTFILITDDRDELHSDFMKKFGYAVAVDSVTTPYAREFGSYIILMKQPTEAAREQWKTRYEGLRKEFRVLGGE